MERQVGITIITMMKMVYQFSNAFDKEIHNIFYLLWFVLPCCMWLSANDRNFHVKYGNFHIFSVGRDKREFLSTTVIFEIILHFLMFRLGVLIKRWCCLQEGVKANWSLSVALLGLWHSLCNTALAFL